jgi:NAD(P)H-flavin reductase
MLLPRHAFGAAGLGTEFMAKQVAEMEVEAATMELPDTKTVRFRWPDGYTVNFKTGQFITLYFPDTPNYKLALIFRAGSRLLRGDR